jgi:hypothetical protein
VLDTVLRSSYAATISYDSESDEIAVSTSDEEEDGDSILGNLRMGPSDSFDAAGILQSNLASVDYADMEGSVQAWPSEHDQYPSVSKAESRLMNAGTANKASSS